MGGHKKALKDKAQHKDRQTKRCKPRDKFTKISERGVGKS